MTLDCPTVILPTKPRLKCVSPTYSQCYVQPSNPRHFYRIIYPLYSQNRNNLFSLTICNTGATGLSSSSKLLWLLWWLMSCSSDHLSRVSSHLSKWGLGKSLGEMPKLQTIYISLNNKTFRQNSRKRIFSRSQRSAFITANILFQK